MILIGENREISGDIILHIYHEYYSWLMKRACERINDESVCNELFNDCVIRWINDIGTLKQLQENELQAYVAGSMDCACAAYLKKESRTVDLFEVGDCRTAEAEDSLRNVEEYVENKDSYEIIKRAVKKLSNREQSIIQMKYVLEMKDREMAQILGIQENSVRMTVRRCIAALQKIIEKEMNGYERR